MMRRSWFLCSWLVLVLGANSRAGLFTFAKIAGTDGGQGFSGFDPSPSINDQGTVVFRARFPANHYGIYKGSGGPLTHIVDSMGEFSVIMSSYPSINNHGTVAWTGIYDQNDGVPIVFTSDGGAITALYDSGDQFGNIGFHTPINDDGVVAFWGQLPVTGYGIYRGDGGPVTMIANAGGPFLDINTVVSMNEAGTVAFGASGHGNGERGIYAGDGGPLTLIDDASSPPYPLIDVNFSINDEGVVAFRGLLAGTGQGIFLGDGTTITPVVDNSGLFSTFAAPTFGSPPAVNSRGDILFWARLDNGAQGLFSGPNPLRDRIIGTGDLLDGSVVTSVGTFHGLNEVGQVAFFAQLADGRSGIYRADLIPEPGTLAMLGLGSWFVLLRRSRLQRRGRGCFSRFVLLASAIVAASGSSARADIPNGTLFWSNRDRIQSSNLDGSGVHNLILGQNTACDVEVDLAGEKLYWTDLSSVTIKRANLDGSGVESLVPRDELRFPGTLELDVASGHMYWGDADSRRIARSNLDGSNVQTILDGDALGQVASLDLDLVNNRIYWTNDHLHEVRSANLDGSDVRVIATVPDETAGIALDVPNGRLYWTEYFTRRLWSADLNGMGPTIIQQFGSTVGPGDLEIDPVGDKLYMADSRRTRIWRMELDGSNPTAVVDLADPPPWNLLGIAVIPIPEPSSLAICMAGAFALVGWRGRPPRPMSA